jgi:hypothetical protein
VPYGKIWGRKYEEESKKDDEFHLKMKKLIKIN